MNARQQYLAEVGKEYNRADAQGRSRLLNEAEKRGGLNRKYLIRVLNHRVSQGRGSGANGERNMGRRW